MCKLNRSDKMRLLRHLPKGAKYIRACLQAHWKLGIELDQEQQQGLHSEPLWRNTRFSFRGVGRKEESFYVHDIGLRKMGDILDPDSRRPRTRTQWRRLLSNLNLTGEWSGHAVSHVAQEIWGSSAHTFVQDTAQRLVELMSQLPEQVTYMLRQLPQTAPFREGETQILTKANRPDVVAVGVMEGHEQKWRVQRADTVRKLADTGVIRELSGYTVRDVAWWSPTDEDSRVGGAYTQTFPLPEGWMVDDEVVRLDRLSIKTRTALLAARKMKPPSAEKAWEERLGFEIDWNKVWRIKSFYASPRDQFTWLRLMHRNLYTVGHRKDLQDVSCRACNEKESQLHLATCSVMVEEFWKPLIKMMEEMGFETPSPEARREFLCLGVLWEAGEQKVVKPEQSGLMFIAWRCLYAAVVGSRVDDVPIDLQRAYKRTLQLTISRLRAYGEKWKLWCNKNRHTGLKSIIPVDKRDRTVIEQDMEGDYQLHPILIQEFTRIQQEISRKKA